MSHSALAISAHWERAVVSTDGGETALVIKVAVPLRKATVARRAPVDVAFVLDRSGSMSGEKLAMAKESVLQAIDRLSEQDRAALVIFDDQIDTLVPLTHVDDRTRTFLRAQTRSIEAGGSTNLLDGWLTGCRQLAEAEAPRGEYRVKRSLLLTDGQANVGIVDPDELAHHARELQQRGIVTTTLGLGAGFDETLLAGMAEAGGGNFQYIRSAADLPSFFQRELGDLLMIGAANVRLELTTPDGIRSWLVSAFDNHRRAQMRTIHLGDLPAGDEIWLVFDVTASPAAIGHRHSLTMTASWIDPVSVEEAQFEFQLPDLSVASTTDAASALVDLVVEEQVALQRAAREQREAMRLDRAGRLQESRVAHRLAVQHLNAATADTYTLRERRRQAQELAEYDPSVGFSDETRKEVTWTRFQEQRRAPRDKP